MYCVSICEYLIAEVQVATQERLLCGSIVKGKHFASTTKNLVKNDNP